MENNIWRTVTYMSDETSLSYDNIRVYIDNLLNSLCVPQKCKGFAYISKAIYMAACKPELLRFAYQDLLKFVAADFEVTVDSLEAAINRAIKSAWKNGDAKIQFSLFGRTVDFSRGYPCAKDFIAALAYRAKLEIDL